MSIQADFASRATDHYNTRQHMDSMRGSIPYNRQLVVPACSWIFNPFFSRHMWPIVSFISRIPSHQPCRPELQVRVNSTPQYMMYIIFHILFNRIISVICLCLLIYPKLEGRCTMYCGEVEMAMEKWGYDNDEAQNYRYKVTSNSNITAFLILHNFFILKDRHAMAGFCISLLFLASHFVSFCAAIPAYSTGAPSTGKTSLTLLFQNNLNATDDKNHVGAILLDPLKKADAVEACSALGEQLITKATLQAHQADFSYQLSYQIYARRASVNQLYWVEDGVVSVNEGGHTLSYPHNPFAGTALPALCTQSSNQDQPSNAVATSSKKLSVASTGNTYIGFRNQKSFRFQGFPYANPPARFAYSKVYSPKGQTLDATTYGSDCAQGTSGSENCLFMNIQTPYIPKVGSKKNLRPVMFWIYGGGFTGGSGKDAGSDGGNLASREDIVVISFNYRLSTLGFLAIPGTDISGNFGISDQVTALQVR
jgi:hypothetical protein